MSRTYLESYSAFNRDILSEVLSEKELKVMDQIYNKAKAKREIKRMKILLKGRVLDTDLLGLICDADKRATNKVLKLLEKCYTINDALSVGQGVEK